MKWKRSDFRIPQVCGPDLTSLTSWNSPLHRWTFILCLSQYLNDVQTWQRGSCPRRIILLQLLSGIFSSGKGRRLSCSIGIFTRKRKKKKKHLTLHTHIERRIKIDIYDTMPKNSIELNAVCSHYKEKYSAGILAEAANNSEVQDWSWVNKS